MRRSARPAAPTSSARPQLLRCDYDAAIFLCSTEDGTSSWRFLDELHFVPEALREIVKTYTEGIVETSVIANDLRAAGMIGHSQEVMSKVADFSEKRSQCLTAYLAPASVRTKYEYVDQAPIRRSRWDAAAVAAELKETHFCVLDDFVPAVQADVLRDCLRSMKASGELKPGEVSGGLKQQTRGDLMAWVSTAAGEQPRPLTQLLAAIDELIGALSQHVALRDELGNGRLLVRHEMQCTCYPGNGARYVRHVDDALANRGRILTCICYLNPSWSASDGGVLRIHARSGPRDIEPLHGRLIVFWSDSRCPHEVMPAYKERYAVSIWISDTDAMAKAAAAERAETRG